MQMMLKLVTLIMTMLALITPVCSEQVELRFSTEMINTMVYNPNPEPTEAPVFKNISVHTGSELQVCGGKVLLASAELVILSMDWEYYGQLHHDDGSFESLGVGTIFTLHPGDTLKLDLVGICDASFIVQIIWDRQ